MPTGRRLLSRRGLLGLAGGSLLAGCAPVSGPGASSGTPTAPQATAPSPAVAPEARVTALRDALAAGERVAFVGGFVPELAAHAGVLFDNARTLGGFELGPLDGGRVGVTWRVGDERLAASTGIGLTFDAAGHVATTRHLGGGSEPVWWRHPVVVARDAGALLVTTRDRAEASAPWLASAGRAVEHLAGVGVARSPGAWDGRLVVEVPHDLLTFDAPPSVACYVHELAGGALRAVLNPTLAGYGESDRLALMVHEGSHVVVGSPRLKAPLWLIEGLAESLALGVAPAQAAAAAATVGRLKDAGVHTLPADADFRSDDPAVTATAYALAEVAHSGCVRRWGADAVLGWLHDWDGGRPPGSRDLQAAFRAELSRR